MVRVPASKSATNRALLLAALSDSAVVVRHPLESDDTRALAECLAAMGATIDRGPEGWSVRGPLGVPEDRATVLDAHDSGTAARFLAALCAATPGDFRLTGSSRLSERPMSALIAALVSLSADVREEGAPGCLPLRIRGKAIPGGSVRVDASQSSQFLSALLLLGAAQRPPDSVTPWEVRAAGRIASEPYVAVTLDALRAFGHGVEGDGPWRVVRGAAAPAFYEPPGDYSSAVPLLAAAGVRGGEVSVEGLRYPSADADAGALEVLRQMGVAVAPDAAGRRLTAHGGELTPVRVRAKDFPDAVPALAALSAFAPGTSRFEGIAHLRWKESDRLAALVALLAAAGTHAVADAESLTVVGGAVSPDFHGGVLPTSRDHRIAMAGGLLSLGRPGLLIEDPDCVAKSYPAFFRDLDELCRR